MASTSTTTEHVTELRVHGVGGTRPEMILEDPHLRRVSGDDLIGFYRPAYDPSHRHAREAASWGKITAGDATRALWVLLLPFALANLAGWTHPPARAARDADSRAGERVVKGLVRVFGLTITLGATLMTANMLIDLVAYQCGEDPACWETRWWLAIFKWRYLYDHPAARLAIGALMCLAALALLLWVSRASYRAFEEYENVDESGEVRQADSGPGDPHPADVGLGHPDFWRGAGPVGQLRDLHASAAIALITAILSFSLLPFTAPAGPLRPLTSAVLALALIVLVVVVLALLTDEAVYRRARPPARARYRRLKLTAYGLFATAAVAALGASAQAYVAEPRLYALDTFNRSYFVVEGLLLGALFVLQLARRPGRDPTIPEYYAFHGMATFAICALALFVLSSASAGGMVRLADLLGQPARDGAPELASQCPSVRDPAPPPSAVEPDSAPETILCYAQHHQKTSIIALVVLVALALVIVRIWLWLRRQATDCREAVIGDLEANGWKRRGPLSEEAEARIRQVAKSYSLSTLVQNSDSLLLRVILIGSAVALVQHFGTWLAPTRSLVAALTDWYWRPVALIVLIAAVWIPLGEQPAPCLKRKRSRRAPRLNLLWICLLAIAEALLSLTFVTHNALANGAAWAVTLLPIALVAGLYGGLRNPNLRRSIGVVWDVITFWPRHFHPFAPPCYGERLVPQLRYRLEHLTSVQDKGTPGRVLLSAHSQGSVVAVAALLQTDPEHCGRIALFTYGSPLEILYRRLFPAYFGGGVIGSVEQSLRPGNIRVPWRHFFCRTDPLGIPMTELSEEVDEATLEAVTPEARVAQANTALLDPHTWEALRGEPPWPLRRHSAYLSHPVFLDNVSRTVEELAAASRSGSAGS